VLFEYQSRTQNNLCEANKYIYKTTQVKKEGKKEKAKIILFLVSTFWLSDTRFSVDFVQVTNQLVKSEIRFRQSGKAIGLNKKKKSVNWCEN
jgi:hypothetical protein